MKYTVESSTSDVTMYRGFVRDDSGKEIARTRPYFNRRNAKAAAVALWRDLLDKAKD